MHFTKKNEINVLKNVGYVEVTFYIVFVLYKQQVSKKKSLAI